MSMFDSIQPIETRILEGTTLRLLDADTVIDDSTGEKYRLPGADAPEVEKLIKDEWKSGEAGGAATTDAVYELMNKLGYTNAKPLLDENGEKIIDPFGRTMADFQNSEGESWSTRAFQEGIYNPTKYTTEVQDLTHSLGEMQRDQEFLASGMGFDVKEDDWDKARFMIDEALVKEGYKQFGLKRVAEDEAELAQANALGAGAYYDQNQVLERDPNRTLDNVSLNPYSDSWDKALIGVKEAAAGLQNMWGELTDNEYHAEAGRLGVERNRERLAKYGTSIVDWKDIDDFSDGIDYVVNNAIMSLPYMGITAASVLAAPIVGTGAAALGAGATVAAGTTLAAGLLAPSSIYAAQTWNEMEGKKNMGVAAASGIMQAALDRLGLHAIFKSGVHPKKLMEEAVENLVKNGWKGKMVSRETALKMVGNATRKSVSEFTGDAAKAAASQITSKAIFKNLATRSLRGGLGEGATEALQEATAYTAATLGSDKTFNYNELIDRIIAGGIAGKTLGIGFSIPGAVYDTGAWVDLKVRKQPAEAKRISEAGARAEEERKINRDAAYELAKQEKIISMIDNGEIDDASNLDAFQEADIENYAHQRAKEGERIQSNSEKLAEERDHVETIKGRKDLSREAWAAEKEQHEKDGTPFLSGMNYLLNKWESTKQNIASTVRNSKTFKNKSKEEIDREIDRRIKSSSNPIKNYQQKIKHIKESTRKNNQGEPESVIQEKIQEKIDDYKYNLWKTAKKNSSKVRGKDQEVKRADITNINDRADRAEAAPVDTSFKSVLDNTLQGSVKLWRKVSRIMMPDRWRDESNSGDITGSIFDSAHEKSFSGRDFESEKHDRTAKYRMMVPRHDVVYAALNNNRPTSRSKRGEISRKLYEILKGAINSDGVFDPSMIEEMINKVEPNWASPELVALIQQLGTSLNQLSDAMYNDQVDYNKKLGYIQNYLFKFKTLSKESVANDKEGFIKQLVETYGSRGMTRAKAKELTERILDNEEINTIDDVLTEDFNVTKGGIVPGSHRKRSLAMSEQDAFQDFMEQDIFANISNAAKSAARYVAHRKFIGENGEIVSSLLDKMEFDDGVPREVVDEIASRIRKFLNAESGNYKRPTTEGGKTAVAVQKNMMFLASFAMLGLATVSSFVEIALSGRALTREQIWGRKGKQSGRQTLESFGREMGQTLADFMGFTGNTVRWKVNPNTNESRGQRIIRDLGYYEWDVGAATVTGVSEMNPLHRKWYELFFKMTGLTGWTNMTRAMRASIAFDFMLDHINKIYQFRFLQSSNPQLVKDNDIQESEEMLRNIGVNVDDAVRLFGEFQEAEFNLLEKNPNASFDEILEAMPPERASILIDNFRTGAFNFINDAVALPTVGNRPLIYQDPRFALFTQFQGFIATFSSNHIPKLWRHYIRRGNPSMKYNAFALMTTMIMLGFASQYLKDLIKFAGSDKQMKTLGNPYLETSEYIQRGIRSSGLLGVSERMLDLMGMDLYEERTKGPLDWAFKTVAGEAPASGIGKRLFNAGRFLSQGEVGDAAAQIGRLTPVIGVAGGPPRVVEAAGNIKEALSDVSLPNWNFKGDK